MSEKLLSELIDSAYELRAEISTTSTELSELKSRLAEMEEVIEQRMYEVGTDRAGGAVANVTLTKEDVPTVEDWEALYNHIEQNQAFHLLQRRPTAAAFREIWDMGETIPGVKPYTKTKVSIRKK